MSILTTISRTAAHYRARRHRLRTHWEHSGLSLEIQRDIGWTGAYQSDERTCWRFERNGLELYEAARSRQR